MKPQTGLTKEDILEIKVKDALGFITRSALGVEFGVSTNALLRYIRDDDIFSKEEVNKAVQEYKKVIKDNFINTVQGELSLRKEIIIRGLIKLKNKITYSSDISAEKLSTIISSVQKDLYLSLGQPTEISAIQNIDDEKLQTIIAKLEKARDTEITREGKTELIEGTVGSTEDNKECAREGEFAGGVEVGAGEAA